MTKIDLYDAARPAVAHELSLEAVKSGGQSQVFSRRSSSFGSATLSRQIKRFLDLLIAVVAIIIFSPLFLLVALAIRLSSPGPVFYRHTRVGKNGSPFGCLKFRTMAPDGDRILRECLLNSPEAYQEWQETQKLKNDPRVTPIGTMLRSSSLDELPQLINVVRGEMSIVGPRPIVEAELARYGRGQEAYLSVRPGITGLWQVSGRNDVSYEARVNFDRTYVENWSLTGDVLLMIKTVPAVLSRKGTY